MTELFGGRFPNWTEMIAFLQSSIDQALDAIPPEPSQKAGAWEDARPLDAILSEGRTTQHLLVPTHSAWLGYFRYEMSSVHHVPQYISRRGRFRTVLVGSSRGGRRLSVYRSGMLIRYLQLSDSGGRWVFHQEGEPLAFEDVAAYERRRIRDRFTSEMLEQYCAALGLRPFDDDFYLPSGIVKVDDGYTPLVTPILRFRRRKTTVRQLR